MQVCILDFALQMSFDSTEPDFPHNVEVCDELCFSRTDRFENRVGFARRILISCLFFQPDPVERPLALGDTFGRFQRKNAASSRTFSRKAKFCSRNFLHRLGRA